jgi:hypothetical protein
MGQNFKNYISYSFKLEIVKEKQSQPIQIQGESNLNVKQLIIKSIDEFDSYFYFLDSKVVENIFKGNTFEFRLLIKPSESFNDIKNLLKPSVMIDINNNLLWIEKFTHNYIENIDILFILEDGMNRTLHPLGYDLNINYIPNRV